MNWKVKVVEYPNDELNDKKLVEQINHQLSKDMTDLAKLTFQKMQKAKCDGLGMGRQLIAFQPEIWKQKEKNWGEYYQQVKFKPNIQIEIIHGGVIN